MLKKTCRWVGSGIGYLVYTLVLLLLLLWLLFPKATFHRLLVESLNRAYPRLSWQVQSMTFKIHGGVTLRGIEGYEVQDTKKPQVRVDVVTVRPDIAGTLKSRRPQAAYRVALAQGVITGRIQMDDWNKGLSVEGSVQGVQLAECAALTRPLEREVQGTFSATFGGRVQPWLGEIPEITMALRVDHGRVGLKRPLLEHAMLPFSRAEVTLQRRGDALQLEHGTVDSELFNGQFSGEIKANGNPAASQLEIKGTLQPRPAFFKGVDNSSMLKIIRTQLKDRNVPFRISGSLDNPGIHFEEFSLLFQSLEKELQ